MLKIYRNTKRVFIGMIVLLIDAQSVVAVGKAEVMSENDVVNYSVGYQIGGDFRKQKIDLNPEMIVQGIRDALQNTTSAVPLEQMHRTLVDLKKRIVAEQEVAAKKSSEENRKGDAAFLRRNARQEGVILLPSGVQYKILKSGAGMKPTLNDEVKVHYRITRVDGKEVANTYVGGKPRTYALARAIPGLQEVLPLMSEGAKWQIVIPSSVASGNREPLDDMGVMIYELELLNIIPPRTKAHGAGTMRE